MWPSLVLAGGRQTCSASTGDKLLLPVFPRARRCGAAYEAAREPAMRVDAACTSRATAERVPPLFRDAACHTARVTYAGVGHSAQRSRGLWPRTASREGTGNPGSVDTNFFRRDRECGCMRTRLSCLAWTTRLRSRAEFALPVRVAGPQMCALDVSKQSV